MSRSRTLNIALRDPVLERILGARELGKDFWVVSFTRIGMENSARGEVGGILDFVLAAPIAFNGDVPSASDPCTGHYGSAERVDPGDPCLKTPRTSGTRTVNFSAANQLSVQVDSQVGAVVNVLGTDLSDSSLAFMIGPAKTAAAVETTTSSASSGYTATP